MKENRPEDPPSAFDGLAAPEPDLTEPDDLIVALDAWGPDASAALEAEQASEGFEHVEVVARHPSKPWVIVRGWDRDNRSHAWVRHAAADTILWEPEGAMLMIWMHQGQEIGLIGETFTPDPHKPAVIGSHLQSEFGYWFERWTWPDRQRISHCPIGMRTGWPTALLEAPDPHLAFFEWYDQGEAGYEGIILDEQHGDRQDPDESYEIGFPELGDDLPLVFSPDARYLVRCHAIPFEDNATCAWERTLVVAYLTIIDRQMPSIRDVPVYRTLPPEWRWPVPTGEPDQVETEDSKQYLRGHWVQPCTFEDDMHLLLYLMDGTSERIVVKEPSLATLPALPSPSPTLHTEPDVDRETLQQVIHEYYRSLPDSVKRLRHPREEATIVSAEPFDRKETEWIVGAEGQVLWEPGDALAMAWVADGHQVALLRGKPYAYRERINQQVAFERRSWPDLTLLQRRELPDWSGTVQALVEIPQAEAVAVVWDTHELHKHSTTTLRRLAFNQEGVTMELQAQVPMNDRSQILAQSPGGARLLCLQQHGVGWPTHQAMFRWTRRLIAGIITVYDWQERSARDIALCETFPANWLPPDLSVRRSALLPWYYATPIDFIDAITFADDHHLTVRFATKREETITMD